MVSRASIAQDVFGSREMVGLTWDTFLAYILPPFMSQYLMGVLVQFEGTRVYRLALLPVTVWLAWRATLVHVPGGKDGPVNITLILQMYSIATRTAVWAFARSTYRRHSTNGDRANGNHDSDNENVSFYTACWNTLDLLMNPRGLGWNWPRGLIVPKPVLETNSRLVFVLLAATQAVLHGLAMDACTEMVHILGPETFGSPNGGSLFDGSLPPAAELLRSMFVSALTVITAYCGLQYTHQVLALLCVGVFRQHPSQWPPLFDSPWLSTSLGELWGRRWHQMMRDMVLTLAGEPLDRLFGRLCGILGAFLASGIFHDVELQASGGQDAYPGMLVGFWVMNGMGIVLERLWQRKTGRPVRGMWGRLWMVGWLFLWGVPAANEYAKAGRFSAMRLPGGLEPTRAFVAFIYGDWWR